MLVGHIIYATVNCIAKVEEDFCKMEELKKKVEAADISKSQVVYFQKHTLEA